MSWLDVCLEDSYLPLSAAWTMMFTYTMYPNYFRNFSYICVYECNSKHFMKSKNLVQLLLNKCHVFQI